MSEEENHYNKLQYYRTFDPIEHFELKIEVAKGEKDLFKNTPTELLQAVLKEEANDDKEEEHDKKSSKKDLLIRWQQKVFSPWEIFTYQPKAEYSSFREQGYHEQVSQLSEKQKRKATKLIEVGSKKSSQQFHLFTYIDIDNYKQEDDSQENKGESLLSDRIVKLRNEAPTVNPLMERKLELAKNNVVDYNIHIEYPLIDNSFREMNLMVFFPHKITKKEPKSPVKDKKPVPKTGEEVRLCCIRWYSNGLITMMPGIDKLSSFVYNNETYNFRISNKSSTFSIEDEKKEWMIFQEYFKRHSTLQTKQIGTTFALIPEVYKNKVDVFGEISCITDFESQCGSDFYVRYVWDLPHVWKIDEKRKNIEDNLSSSTQCCRGKYYDGLGIEARFGFPFDIGFLTDCLDDLNQKPRLYLEVFSVDYWDRHNLQGYTYIDLPQTPGVYEFDQPTWKPCADGYIDKVKSFFIGGGPEFSDLSYVASDRGQKGMINKYGLMTESNGRIQVKMNIAFQSRMLNKVSNLNDKANSIFGHRGVVSDALLRAKARLESLKHDKKNI